MLEHTERHPSQIDTGWEGTPLGDIAQERMNEERKVALVELSGKELSALASQGDPLATEVLRERKELLNMSGIDLLPIARGEDSGAQSPSRARHAERVVAHLRTHDKDDPFESIGYSKPGNQEAA